MHNLHILSLFVSCIIAAPAPQAGSGVFGSPDCTESYTITNQHTIEGDLKTGDYTVGGGSTLNAGSTFSTSVTVTVGSGISISKVAGLDLSASIAKTTTKSVSQGASGPCPQGPWKCALAIFPQLLDVSGEKKHSQNMFCNSGDPPPSTPYEVTFPVEGDSGAVRSRVEVCACRNFPHWADKGAPSIVCDNCA